MISRRVTVSALIFFSLAMPIVVVPSGSGRAATAAYRPVPALAATVTLKNFTFTPKVLRVKAGTAVTWKSAEGSHTVVADDGSFRSPTINQGQTYSFTFATPGTYLYYCSFHGQAGGHDMAGKVIVTKN